MLRLLSDTSDGPKLKISSETGYACLRDAAVIASPYQAGENAAGAIAVIAPMKTDYAHIVPLVKYVSDAVGGLITGNLEADSRKDSKNGNSKRARKAV